MGVLFNFLGMVPVGMKFSRYIHKCAMFCPVHHPTLTSFYTYAGIVYTEEPVVRSFARGGNLEFNVNIFNHPLAQYINSLAWYHNGTQIVSGNRHRISSNDTMLMISNMVGSDAGTYEVKVRSISYDSDLNSPLCDSIIAPLLELIPNFRPVTFTVQGSHPPSYDPSSIISIAYVSDNANSIRLNGTLQYNSPISITETYPVWFRNGIVLSDGDMYNSTGEGLSLQIMYSNTADVTGSYEGILWTSVDNLSRLCEGYHNYIILTSFVPFIFTPFFWIVKREYIIGDRVTRNRRREGERGSYGRMV